MNVEKETEILESWKEHINILENTKTFHPYPLYSCIRYWKYKVIEKEKEIVKYLIK